MRTLLLLPILAIASCSPMIVFPSLKSNKCIRVPSETFVLRFGDDRFHDDNELVDEIYHVYGSDTILHDVKQRVRWTNRYVK